MAEFTTTNDGGWVFDFESKPNVPNLPVHDPLEQQGPQRTVGYLEGPGKWENYSDDVLYEVESLFRKFMDDKAYSEEWMNDKRGYWRRYTCGMMFEQLYGRKVDIKDHTDQLRLRRLVKILSYFSTRIQKEGSIRGKKLTKSIYTISPRLYKTKPPYCLKIRLQWLQKKGELPCWQNMKLPKDDLKPGQARNKKTNENMRIRRERARELYNKRYADRKR